MHLTLLIVRGRRLLQVLKNVPIINHNLILPLLRVYHKLQYIQKLARIPSRKANQRILLHQPYLEFLQVLICGHRPMVEHHKILFLKRFKHINLTPRQQGRNNLKRRIFGRGTNEHHNSLLHRSQQTILLTLAKAVNLVNKQKGCRWIKKPTLTSLLYHLSHILNARTNGRKRMKRTLKLRRNYLSQRGFAHSWRSPKYYR